MLKPYSNLKEKAATKLIFDNSFIHFSKYFFEALKGEKFIANWHHYYFASLLEDVYSGKLQNIIINTPPGSTKSVLFSVLYPAWCFSKNSQCRFLLASYSDNLVAEFSQSVKDIIECSEFKDLYPGYSFKPSSDKKSEWILQYFGKDSGELYAASMAGKVTGKRAGYMRPGFSGAMIMDDISKPDDMNSEAKRNRSNNLIYSTARSRKGNPNVPIIIIQQRLHVEDASGYILGLGNVDNFKVFKIPAIINEEYINTLPPKIAKMAFEKSKPYLDKYGESSYWVEKETLDELYAMKSADSNTFEAQYMQDPIPKGGLMINVSNFKKYEDIPNNIIRVSIFADTAIGVKNRNDFSVLMVVGETDDNNTYILDICRGKWEAPQLNSVTKSFCAKTMSKYKDIPFGGVFIEFKSSGQQLIQTLRQETHLPVFDINPKGDKVLRLNQVLPYIASGRVFIPEKASWTSDFIKECSAFSPLMNHKHDDQIDTLVYALMNIYVSKRKAKVNNIYF